jgi:2-iminobutanoate/2-iminopropanoate deaminase
MNEYGRTPVQISSAPLPIGPYSQAIKSGNLVFVSGQIAIDPASGALVAGDAAAQTRVIMGSIQAILEAAGSSLARVAKTTIFLTDLADFTAVNQVYGEFFTFEPPARSCVQVSALPKGAKVEIEVISTASGM